VFAEGPLPPLSGRFAATRAGLHRVAEEVVAPARKPDNEISLRATPGGFGTPPFEHDGSEHRVRVDGVELVHEAGGERFRAPLNSVAGAAELVVELLHRDLPTDRTPLELDPDSAAALAAWFALGRAVLERLREEAAEPDSPPPRLWPEHFDIAIEAGDEAAGLRANYGFSPGDDDHDEPYLYVGPWRGDVSGELWTARGFSGAELGYAELLAAGDPVEAALTFCRDRREALERI